MGTRRRREGMCKVATKLQAWEVSDDPGWGLYSVSWGGTQYCNLLSLLFLRKLIRGALYKAAGLTGTSLKYYNNPRTFI